MDNVLMVVVKTVNCVRARGLIHCQFYSFLNFEADSHGLSCHIEVRSLSQRIALMRFLTPRGNCMLHEDKMEACCANTVSAMPTRACISRVNNRPFT